MGKKAKRKAAAEQRFVDQQNWLFHGMLLMAAQTDPRITVLPPPPGSGSPWPCVVADPSVLSEVLQKHAEFVRKALREYAETPRS